MRSQTEAAHDEAVPVPLIFGPPRYDNVRTRQLRHLRSHKLPVNKQLHLNTPPWISIIHDPTRNTLLRCDSFTPTMKRRWKGSRIDHDRKRADKNRLDD